MTKQKFLTGLLALTLPLGSVGCDEWLGVDNISVIDSSTVDPSTDAETFARSAFQTFAESLGWHLMYGSWFTYETRATDTFPTRNDFNRRDIPVNNGDLAGRWSTLSRGIAAGLDLLSQLSGTDGADSNPEIARAAFAVGGSMLMAAEYYCQGTFVNIVDGASVAGGPLTTVQMADSAVKYLTRVIDIAPRVTGSKAADITALANAALVYRARAHLMAGRSAQALADAQAVPAGFELAVPYFDDPNNRGRLGNRFWVFTLDRGSVSPNPVFWTLGDERAPVVPPDGALFAQDGIAEFYQQGKFRSYNAPIRLASKLEADYIVAELQGTAAQLAMIVARRAASDQPVYAGGTDATSVLREFLWQKTLDFFLEGQRMGDFRRHGTNVPLVPEPGTAYWKADYEPIGDDVCWPLPDDETDSNPNF